jgi:nicotinamidase-related amidase
MSDGTPTALLLVDVVNTFDFDGAEALLARAGPAAEAIADLAARAREAGAPVVYANDNFGEWTETFDALVARCTRDDAAGCALVDRLRPRDGDYFVLKPSYSAFYETSLQTLLRHLGAGRLVVAGFATDICVLATALDAAMRDYAVVVPEDAAAAETEEAHRTALAHLRRAFGAETPPASAVALGAVPAAA